MKFIKTICSIAILIALQSCNKYLDIVPDNIATLDNAFSMRATAEKFLFTCYSYVPRNGDFNANPAMTAGDEIWYMDPAQDVGTNFWEIAKGNQNAANPYGNMWSGGRGGSNLFVAIRDCNIFLERIGSVKDLESYERGRWIAEVKFLKAYYNYLLLRAYGPIPLIKENLPITSNTEETKVFRAPVDDCVSYIAQLLDEAAAEENLPDRIQSEVTEQGRVIRPMVLGLKARLLVMAASPLFNGNTDYLNLKDSKGRQLFNPTVSPAKWDSARVACQKAVELCEAAGFKLHRFNPALAIYKLDATGVIQRQLDIRTAVTEKWNSEVIWANTLSLVTQTQRYSMPIIAATTRHANNPKGIIAPTMQMAELFYTNKGLPINMDNTWDYSNRLAIKKVTAVDMNKPENVYNKYYVKSDFETVKLHYDREPRFYADMGFDGGLWYGNGVGTNANYNPDAMLYVTARSGQLAARQGQSNFAITGYMAKKMIHFTSNTAADGQFAMVNYPFPEMRLSDLYLLYTEALNESTGPGAETFKWIDLVRDRAGVPSVNAAWNSSACKQVGKQLTKDGLREIIQQERLIELAFEGQRYWDLKRWKLSQDLLNSPIRGWDIDQKDAVVYYKPRQLFNQTFRLRDYLSPIPTNEVIKNRNLVQNPGW